MARGGKRGHKGGRRQFTNPQALEQQQLKLEKEKAWRKQRGEEDSDEEEDEEAESKKSSGEEDGSSSNEEEDSSSEEEEEEEEEATPRRSKGTSGLIEIENPNHIAQREKKVTSLDTDASGAPQLSRREKEEIRKQRAREYYLKLHREGKTDEARADLARLAIVRKQREEAAKKREEERKSKEQAATHKKDTTAKALGKRT